MIILCRKRPLSRCAREGRSGNVGGEVGKRRDGCLVGRVAAERPLLLLPPPQKHFSPVLHFHGPSSRKDEKEGCGKRGGGGRARHTIERRQHYSKGGGVRLEGGRPRSRRRRRTVFGGDGGKGKKGGGTSRYLACNDARKEVAGHHKEGLHRKRRGARKKPAAKECFLIII